ncbi:hypothetical protein [Streptomyces roseolus]|uniref:hypothetical protein n=1 Tax=Streptomyces roseolus TaxID=67358 RepID=UPI00167C1A9D|nr:hypothetical protein [Streptomyces roseolus]GGR52110.1 hypothetical protein GCM10010282_51400 [Streptomyces roseolus]
MIPEGQPATVETRLAVLEVKLDQLLELNKSRGEDHENRIRKLEERKFPLPTIAVLVASLSLIATVVMYVVNLKN